MGIEGAMMGFLDEVLGGVSGTSGASYRDYVYEEKNNNENKKGKHIYEECREVAPLAPYPPLSRVEQVTLSLGWNGAEMVMLPACRDCEHFTPDTINPASGLGDCEVFLLPDGKRQIGRYPMQHPKTATCFEKGESK